MTDARLSSRRGAALLWILLAVVVLAAAWHWRAPLLAPAGTFLVRSEAPVRADAVVVLAGGFMGERILKAAELVRDGYAPYALMSGPKRLYEVSECDLAIPYAGRKGFPASYFACAPNAARSTWEEAVAILPELERRGARSILLVTSDYHTGRAARMWRKAAPGLEIHPVAARSPEFDIRQWWRSREGWKALESEWVKTLTSPLGI